ncbi:hypothetical protein [Streptomyces apocyni]|uniref:hypothetical protein n=1 Tax=Streptomyces apocyni TaxID=2654677 RepID=UPI0012EAD551|nr:hypothetical protein [Streptomyces apocyni]
MTESNVHRAHRDRLDHREPPTIDATHATHATEATDGTLDTTAQLLTRITAQLGSQLGRVSLSAHRHP